MSQESRIKDSFIYGVIIGLISITVFYYLFTFIRSIIMSNYGAIQLLRPPVVQLLTMMMNLIIFRVLMINYKMEKTGKGVLFVTVILTLMYFFIRKSVKL